MVSLLAIGLLGFHPFDVVVSTTHCDLIELNHMTQDAGWAHQYIFWESLPFTLDMDLKPPQSTLRVVDWRWAKIVGREPTACRGGVQQLWTDPDGMIHRVVAKRWFETATTYDPEVLDRHAIKMVDRRGLGVPRLSAR